jgi:hypothetical protein
MPLMTSDVGPFVAHMIGDFILQNEWLAREKKHSSWVCLVHVAIYMLPFLLCSLHWWQLTAIAVQHFAQDRSAFVLWWLRVWKRVPSQHRRGLAIFVDQAFHVAWIWLIIELGKLTGS